MKRMLSLALASVVAVSALSIGASADQELAYKYAAAESVLRSSGMTEEQINDIPFEELLTFAEVKPSIAISETYYKISVDENTEELSASVMSREDCLAAAAEANAKQYELFQNRLTDVSLSSVSSVPDTGLEDPVTTSDGYLWYSVRVFPFDEDGKYKLIAQYQWLSDPVDRDTDVFGLGHGHNVDQLGNYQDVYYYYKYDEYFVTAGHSWLAESDITTNTPTSIKVDNGGTVITQKLQADSGGMQYVNSAENHRGYISYDVELNTSAATRVSIYAEYLHQEAIIAVEPSVSYPTDGSITVTKEDKFVRMSPNPYLSFAV